MTIETPGTPEHMAEPTTQIPIEKLTKKELIEVIYDLQRQYQEGATRRNGEFNFVDIELPGIGNIKMQSPAEGDNGQLFANALTFFSKVEWKQWGRGNPGAFTRSDQMI